MRFLGAKVIITPAAALSNRAEGSTPGSAHGIYGRVVLNTRHK
jgi:hypothetical protein